MMFMFKKIRNLLIGLAVMLVMAPVTAKEMSITKPERQGFSTERLAKLTQLMNAKVEDGTMVGGMGMIARNGKIIYSQTYGQADREAGKAMADDAIFRIYSMTKPITGVALMMLYEEGKFRLNDPIAMYIPEMANLQVALSTGGTGIVSDGTTSTAIGSGDESLVGQTRKPTRQPTIRDLMTHTSGLTYGIFGNTEVDQAYRKAGLMGDMDLKEFVTALGKLPLQYDPGSQWHYSVSVDVQGYLVEVLSGMKFSEFLEQRIFAPLDMQDTAFKVNEGNKDRLAQLYKPEGVTADNYFSPATGSGLEVADAFMSAGYIYGVKFESGGGGLVATARDYLRFSQMMLNGGELDGVRILSPKTVDLMTTNHIGDLGLGYGRKGIGFGLDFAVVLNPGELGEVSSAGEYNWGGAAGTRFWIDPQEQLIGLFMVQSIPHRTRLADDFKVMTYQALVEKE
ncbi:MAG: serine hydrolase [Pseudomonadales bacterium]|jgi:CubicO group peptidase (beta-lactamase class C family)|nr:serine hydrolase [Pseudomonadales bacterium]